MEAHGGRIWAESDGPGLGARFTFTMPTVEQAGAVSQATSVPSSTRSSRRRASEQVRVLAVDDDPQALRLIRDALLKSGYTPIVTVDAEEALRLMQEERPHLALLDVVLPGTDGMELMQEIVGRAEVPVIFLSAHGQEQLVARALDMGAADYLVKPFSPVELAARIRAALRRREMPEPSTPYVLGEPDHRLRRAAGDRGRPSGPAQQHRVPGAGRACGQRRAGADLRAPAEGHLGRWGRRRPQSHAHRDKQPAPQAGRRWEGSHLHLHPAPRGLPDARGGGMGTGGDSMTMNDPHVEAIHYIIDHDDSVDYRDAAPLAFEDDLFRVKAEKLEVVFEPKNHYATAAEARIAVEGLVRRGSSKRPSAYGPANSVLYMRTPISSIATLRPAAGCRKSRPHHRPGWDSKGADEPNQGGGKLSRSSPRSSYRSR